MSSTFCQSVQSKKACRNIPAGFHFTILQFPDILGAFCANALALILTNLHGAAAEHTGGLIFLQDNRIISFDINLQLIALGDIQRTTQLNRQYDTTQLIYFSHNTG